MISDVLFEAVTDIDGYLVSGFYDHALHDQIIALRDEMDFLRHVLDTRDPVGGPLPSKDETMPLIRARREERHAEMSDGSLT